jgi:predicted enzyme related to lactoylglutathione lyase
MAMNAVRGERLGARQLRLVVEVEDYDVAVRFHRDVLGLPEELSLDGPGEARVTILEAGRARLEIVNSAQKAMIDDLEVGRPVAPKLRFAFEVSDSAAVPADVVAAGAELLAPAAQTPWRSLNSRLGALGGLQLTIFQELSPGRA